MTEPLGRGLWGSLNARVDHDIQELARELKIERKLLYTWRNQLEGHPEPRHANLATTAEERKDMG